MNSLQNFLKTPAGYGLGAIVSTALGGGAGYAYSILSGNDSWPAAKVLGVTALAIYVFH